MADVIVFFGYNICLIFSIIFVVVAAAFKKEASVWVILECAFTGIFICQTISDSVFHQLDVVMIAILHCISIDMDFNKGVPKYGSTSL